jgi:hypothetical protein
MALYRGELPAAAEPVEAPLRGFAHTLDRFVQAGYIRGLDTRARRRLALAGQASDVDEAATLLRGAERHARAMLGQKTRWGDALAHLLRAGAAATRGDHDRSLRLLESAEAGFAAADMALHAAAARRRRGELLGGDTGRALVTTADAWMAQQSIKRPERMTAMLAPGRWRTG